LVEPKKDDVEDVEDVVVSAIFEAGRGLSDRDLSDGDLSDDSRSDRSARLLARDAVYGSHTSVGTCSFK
jgi:hypothetical protein